MKVLVPVMSLTLLLIVLMGSESLKQTRRAAVCRQAVAKFIEARDAETKAFDTFHTRQLDDANDWVGKAKRIGAEAERLGGECLEGERK